MPFLDHLGLKEGEAESGRARLRLPLQTKHLRSLGIAHGGVIASLLDTVIGAAAQSLCGPDRYVVTAQLSIHFIRPGWDGEDMIGTGEVLHSGRQTAVGRGEVHNQAGTLVAIGSATFLFLAHTAETRERLTRRDENVPAH